MGNLAWHLLTKMKIFRRTHIKKSEHNNYEKTIGEACGVVVIQNDCFNST
jgi:hypothetical protein